MRREVYSTLEGTTTLERQKFDLLPTTNQKNSKMTKKSIIES